MCRLVTRIRIAQGQLQLVSPPKAPVSKPYFSCTASSTARVEGCSSCRYLVRVDECSIWYRDVWKQYTRASILVDRRTPGVEPKERSQHKHAEEAEQNELDAKTGHRCMGPRHRWRAPLSTWTNARTARVDRNWTKSGGRLVSHGRGFR